MNCVHCVITYSWSAKCQWQPSQHSILWSHCCTQVHLLSIVNWRRLWTGTEQENKDIWPFFSLKWIFIVDFVHWLELLWLFLMSNKLQMHLQKWILKHLVLLNSTCFQVGMSYKKDWLTTHNLLWMCTTGGLQNDFSWNTGKHFLFASILIYLRKNLSTTEPWFDIYYSYNKSK